MLRAARFTRGRIRRHRCSIAGATDEDLITERIEALEDKAQTVRLDIAGLRVTIRVEPQIREEKP
ncbi:MAG: hypothetical protein WBC59_02165 [Phycisphaerae bacterium]